MVRLGPQDLIPQSQWIFLFPSPALAYDFGGQWLLSYSLHLRSKVKLTAP